MYWLSGAIALSGSPNISMSLATAHVQNGQVPGLLQCSNADPSAEVACMRQVWATINVLIVESIMNNEGVTILAILSTLSMLIRAKDWRCYTLVTQVRAGAQYRYLRSPWQAYIIDTCVAPVFFWLAVITETGFGVK